MCKMTTRSSKNKNICFTCGKLVGTEHFPLSSRLVPLKKALLNTISDDVRQSFADLVVNGKLMCYQCAALLDLANDLESKLKNVWSTLLSSFSQKFKDTLGSYLEDGSKCPSDKSHNSHQNGAIFCKSNQDKILVAKVSTTETRNGESFVNLEEERGFIKFCKFCTFSSNSQEVLNSHISLEHKICNECNLDFKSSEEFENHLKVKHVSEWTCHVCDKVFFSKSLFTKHSRLHIKGLSDKSTEKNENINGDQNSNLLSEKSLLFVQKHQCNYCNFSTCYKSLYDDHIRNHVTLKVFKCGSCNQSFLNKVLLNEHEKSHKKMKYVCGVCGISYVSRDLVISHLKENHKQSSLMKSGLKQIKDYHGKSCQASISKSDNYKDDVPLVASNSSLEIDNFHNGPSPVRKTGVVKGENPISELNKEFSDAIHQDIPKKDPSSLKCKFVEDIESESLCKNARPIIKELPNEGTHIQMKKSISVNDSLSTALPRSIKNSISFQESHNSKTSCQEGNNKHLVSLQNEGDPCDIEKGITSAIIPSEDLTIPNKGLSSEHIESCCQSMKNKEDSFDENSISDVKMLEENENDRNRESLVSLDSFVGSENLNKTVEDNRGEKKGKISKVFICGKCGYKSLIASKIIEHIAIHTGKESERIPSDGEGTSTDLSQPNMQGNLPSGDEKFSCSYCEWESDDKLKLRNHINEFHLKDTALFICRFCEKKFTSKPQLVDHELSHNLTKDFHCKMCRKIFSSENILINHKRIVHSSSKCCFCAKDFRSIEELTKHKMKHEQEDGYQCLECPRIFKTKTGLKFHCAQHTGEYKFRCQFCHQGFMSRVVYQEHMGKHTKEERYVCDVCGRKFCFQSTYWIHRKWHDNPFPYKCDICDRPFRHSSLLKVHKRQHTGERPYSCPHCSRSFSVSGTLKRHLMLHTGDYAFSCNECEKGFTTKNKYALHLSRVHGNNSLLQQGPPKTEFKMVIKEDPKVKNKAIEGKVNAQELVVERYEELDSMMVQDGGIVGEGADLLKDSSLILPCSILDDVGESLETRVVEILVNSETSQAVASVTVEGNSTLGSW